MNPSVERALCSASRLFLAVSCQPLVSDMIRLDVNLPLKHCLHFNNDRISLPLHV